MRTVDDYLREHGAQPAQRPLRAFLEVSRALNLGLRMVTTGGEPEPGVFVGDDMSLRLFNWYAQNYDSKLKMDFGPGRVVLMIRSEPWVVQYPMVLGTVRFIVDTIQTQQQGGTGIGKPEVPVVNILDLINKLPPKVRRSFSEQEQRQIGTAFIEGFLHMQALSTVLPKGMCQEVLCDLDIAVEHIESNSSHHLGLSKWSSLQAAEKCLKTFISEQGSNYPRTHDLEKLATQAYLVGLKKINSKWIPLIQCNPSIRYGAVSIDLQDAHAAHWASVCLVGTTAKQMQP